MFFESCLRAYWAPSSNLLCVVVHLGYTANMSDLLGLHGQKGLATLRIHGKRISYVGVAMLALYCDVWVTRQTCNRVSGFSTNNEVFPGKANKSWLVLGSRGKQACYDWVTQQTFVNFEGDTVNVS